MAAAMASPAHEHYREGELRTQHSRDNSRDSGVFHTTKGLWNAPGLNNCFLNSAVQGTNSVEELPNTFKNYYFAHSDSEDADEVLPLNQQSLKRSRSTTSIDEFFDGPKPKRKQNKSSSTVGKAQKGGISYISTNANDVIQSTHLIKIEVYDLKKLTNVPINEHWKQADVRVKFYAKEADDIYKQNKKLIYNITNNIANSVECKKYFFNST